MKVSIESTTLRVELDLTLNYLQELLESTVGSLDFQ
jgi:hypothetical protein